jgi:predicted 3-demethylubiquinone-9 3-methyltransferase (glyoxalase superfamily)
MAAVLPFLMFQDGKAEDAMRLYTELLPQGEIVEAERYGAGEQGAEGTIKRAKFTLGGQTVLCIDSPIQHAFGFTPSFSFFVECGSEDELGRLYAGLSAGGSALMPLGEYGFSRKFGWVSDRFGVSWQLNLA